MLTDRIPLPRRHFLGAAAAFGLAASLPAGRLRASVTDQRIVALNWASAQNLLALGLIPPGIPEVERYARLVVDPAAPAQVRELGLRSEPNLELLIAMKPDLLVLGEDLVAMRPRLETIAPTFLFEPDQPDQPDHITSGRAALTALAERVGALPACADFLGAFEAELAKGRQHLRDYDGRPLFVATVLDGRRMLVFGKNSLFQNVLDHFGIENAWTGFTSRFGHATVNVDRLSDRPEARLLCIGNEQVVTMERLHAAPVISSLPFVRENRICLMPEVLFYGGLPSARRFARLAPLALMAGVR